MRAEGGGYEGATEQQGLIDFRELVKLVPLGKTRIYELEKAGRFPRRVHIGGAKVAWDRAEILQWIDDRKADRSNGVGSSRIPPRRGSAA